MSSLIYRMTNYYTNTKEGTLGSVFKQNHTFAKRKEESKRIKEKYPDRVPIICERASTNIPDIDRKKYLVPNDLTLANFMYVIRKRIKLDPEKSIYLFVNDTIAPCSSLMMTLYDKHADHD